MKIFSLFSFNETSLKSQAFFYTDAQNRLGKVVASPFSRTFPPFLSPQGRRPLFPFHPSRTNSFSHA